MTDNNSANGSNLIAPNGGNLVNLIAEGDRKLDVETAAKFVRAAGTFLPLPGSGQVARSMEGSADYMNDSGSRNIYTILTEGKDR